MDWANNFNHSQTIATGSDQTTRRFKAMNWAFPARSASAYFQTIEPSDADTDVKNSLLRRFTAPESFPCFVEKDAKHDPLTGPAFAEIGKSTTEVDTAASDTSAFQPVNMDSEGKDSCNEPSTLDKKQAYNDSLVRLIGLHHVSDEATHASNVTGGAEHEATEDFDEQSPVLDRMTPTMENGGLAAPGNNNWDNGQSNIANLSSITFRLYESAMQAAIAARHDVMTKGFAQWSNETGRLALVTAEERTACVRQRLVNHIKNGTDATGNTPKDYQLACVAIATGATVLGVGGATTGLAVGLAAGGTLGIVFGAALAPFTFGLSLPVGAAVGGGAGLVVGPWVGGATGSVSGGAIGYGVFRQRQKIVCDEIAPGKMESVG